jgi:transcriptional regulator with XRE-family HTH domain
MPNAETFDFSPTAIRARRLKVGLTPEQLAVATGNSVGTIESWEAGRRAPRERVRPLILAALGFDAPDVLVSFVRRTAASSNVAERIEDAAAAEEVGRVLRGGGA